MKSNYTFALIKPDAFWRGNQKKILKRLKDAGFRTEKERLFPVPPLEKVKAHLQDLKQKNLSAYNRNVEFLAKGPVLALLLVHDQNAVTLLREVIGSTDPEKAAKHSIRGTLCIDTLQLAEAQNRGLENSIHASDSVDAVLQESTIWFN